MNIDVSRNSLILLEVQLVTASLGVSICAAIFSLYGKYVIVVVLCCVKRRSCSVAEIQCVTKPHLSYDHRVGMNLISGCVN